MGDRLSFEPCVVDGMRRWTMAPQRLARALRPYRDNCKYLESIEFEHRMGDGDGDGDGEPALVALARMRIGESCYIDSTGHFNAVEFQICANQLMYALGAECARLGLIEAFASIDLEGYYERQLSNVLITNVSAAFRRVLNPRRFYGRLELERAYLMRERAFWECALRYYDDDDGLADGAIVVSMGLGEKLAPKQ